MVPEDGNPDVLATVMVACGRLRPFMEASSVE